MAVAKLPLTIGHHVPNREPVRVEKAVERLERACAAPDEELVDRDRAKIGLGARLDAPEVLPPEAACTTDRRRFHRVPHRGFDELDRARIGVELCADAPLRPGLAAIVEIVVRMGVSTDARVAPGGSRLRPRLAWSLEEQK